jgi:hypothetical protein
MAGFPTRFSRSSLGPRPENKRLVKSAKRELGADVGDMILHGVAAGGVMLPLAFASAYKAEQPGGVWPVGPLVLHASGEAWDPDGAFVPTFSRSGTGLFTVEYPATTLDKDGIEVPIVFRGATVGLLPAAATYASGWANWLTRPIAIQTYAGVSLADPDLICLVLH